MANYAKGCALYVETKLRKYSSLWVDTASLGQVSVGVDLKRNRYCENWLQILQCVTAEHSKYNNSDHVKVLFYVLFIHPSLPLNKLFLPRCCENEY